MKYLGSKLDTNEDISRRKQLAMTAIKTSLGEQHRHSSSKTKRYLP